MVENESIEDKRYEKRTAKTKITKLGKKGLITEWDKIRLKDALEVSDKQLRIVVNRIISSMASAIVEDMEAEHVSNIHMLVIEAVKAQILLGRLYKVEKKITSVELLRTLELYLEAMTKKATYEVSIVLGTITLNMLKNFFDSEPSATMRQSVQIKSIYVPNNPIPADGIIDYLFELQETRGVPYFEGPEKIEQFAESAKGAFVLNIGDNYGPEINQLVIKAISKESIILNYSNLEFKDEDASALNLAVEASSLPDNSLVMLYQGVPVIKRDIDPASEQIYRYNKSVKVKIVFIPAGVFPLCHE